MSDLSSTYSEYEKVSGLFRQLNEAALIARQSLLGIDPPPAEEQNEVSDGLDKALEKLTQRTDSEESLQITEGLSLAEMLERLPDEDDGDLSPEKVSGIRGRIRTGGLRALTTEDIETIERITAALDSASELLFRRIQK